MGQVTRALIGGVSFDLGAVKWDPQASVDAARGVRDEVGSKSLYFDALRYLDEVMKEQLRAYIEA
jgi:hypothetical protein